MPYLILGLVLVALLAVQTLNRQWSTDYWVHQATVETFRQDLADPLNELTHSDDPSPSYTPYTFVLAAVARATGWASVTVLQVAAIANLVGFLVAFELFVTTLTRRRLAAFFALLATLFLWGIDPWRWSGFLNLNSIGFGLPYPSMFATALALLIGWATLRYDETGSRWWLLVVGPGFAVVTLTHPFTGVWTAIMLVALALHRRLYRRERVWPLAATVGIASALIVVWPYYSLVELLRVGESYDQTPLYERVPLRLIAAAPGVYVVFRRFQRDRTDPLALMLIGALVVYGYGAVVDDSNFGRVLPLALFAVQIAIGVFVADMVERHTRPSRPLLAWIAVSVVVGVIGTAPGLTRTVPRALLPESVRDRKSIRPITDGYEGLGGVLPQNSVVASDDIELRVIAPAYGLGVLSPIRPAPFVDDLDARIQANGAFVEPSATPDDRRAVRVRYGVNGVLCRHEACVRLFEGSGDVVARGPTWTLIRLEDDADQSSPT